MTKTVIEEDTETGIAHLTDKVKTETQEYDSTTEEIGQGQDQQVAHIQEVQVTETQIQ